MQQRLAPSEALDLIEIQRMGIVIDHTGEQEQRQLHQRMVHHVQHCAVGGQCVVLAQQADHGDAHGDKADLGQGGAGQNILEIGGEHRQHRAQHHGNGAQHQQQHTPCTVAGEHLAGQQQDAEDTGFGQHTAEEGRCRSRRYRMGFGQPDMQGEQTGLGGEAKQDAHRSGPQTAGLRGGAGFVQLRDHQRAGDVVQKEQAHQRHQTAQHRNGQVGFAGVHGVGSLLLHHPDIGAEGHQFKEQEGGVQVGGQKHACRKAQANQEEEVIPLELVVPMEVLGTQQSRDEPHEAHHKAVQLLETAGPEAQAHHRYGNGGTIAGDGRIDHGQQRQQRKDDGQRPHPPAIVVVIRQDSDHDGGQNWQ